MIPSAQKPLDFQSIMFALQTYWAKQGCLIWQPYYSQVGAGTMNPATFLRVLGPEPWKVAYVEPSVRPDDGRYGVNPKTTQKWRTRDFVHAAPLGPKIIRSKSLSQAEEAVVVAFRIFTQLPLDDCLYSLQGFDTASDPLFSASLLAATWSVEVAPEKQRRKKSSSNRIL